MNKWYAWALVFVLLGVAALLLGAVAIELGNSFRIYSSLKDMEIIYAP